MTVGLSICLSFPAFLEKHLTVLITCFFHAPYLQFIIIFRFINYILLMFTGIRTYDPLVEEPFLLYTKSMKTSSLVTENTISSLEVKVKKEQEVFTPHKIA